MKRIKTEMLDSYFVFLFFLDVKNLNRSKKTEHEKKMEKNKYHLNEKREKSF